MLLEKVSHLENSFLPPGTTIVCILGLIHAFGTLCSDETCLGTLIFLQPSQFWAGTHKVLPPSRSQTQACIQSGSATNESVFLEKPIVPGQGWGAQCVLEAPRTLLCEAHSPAS